MKKSIYTIAGKRKGTFQIDVRRMSELDATYNELLDVIEVKVDESLLSSNWSSGRRYLERIINQINGTYQFGYYDACAVLCRRAMESLIVEVYISKGREIEIKNPDNKFKGLENLITKVTSDFGNNLGRNSLSIMNKIKEVGDTAAHDRVYMTTETDIDDIKIKYRKLIYELLTLSGILK